MPLLPFMPQRPFSPGQSLTSHRASVLCKGLAAVQWLHQANVQRGHAGVMQAGAEGQLWAGGTGGGQAQALGDQGAPSSGFPTCRRARQSR